MENQISNGTELDVIISEAQQLVSDQPFITAVVIILLLAGIFVLIKQRKLKAVISGIVKDIIEEQKAQGKTIEIIVDDMISKAIAKVKEKPDKIDKYLLWVLNSKYFRGYLISLAKKAIELLTGDTPEEVTLTDNK